MRIIHALSKLFSSGQHSPLAGKLNQFDHTLPVSKAVGIPPIWYTDPEIYEAEREAIFGKNWISVGHEIDTQNPGEYVTENIAGEPVFIVKDEDTRRTFLNICSHRSTTLLPECQGTLPLLKNGPKVDHREIQCPYHGWTYNMQGKLCGAPGFGRGKQDDFSPKQNGLRSFETASWGPLIFMRMEPGKNTLENVLAPIRERVSKEDLSKLEWKGRMIYEIDCNWKVFVDNYLDGGYHVSVLHPSLSGALNCDEYSTQVFDYCSLQQSPTQAIGNDPIAQARQGSDAMYWWVFPNTMINIYEGVMDTNIVLPDGPNKCKVIFDYYFSKDKDSQSIIDYIDGAHKTQLEDMKVSKWVQTGLQSRYAKAGRFGKAEPGIYHFHKLLAEELKAV